MLSRREQTGRTGISSNLVCGGGKIWQAMLSGQAVLYLPSALRFS